MADWLVCFLPVGILTMLGQVKKHMFLVRISIKKREWAGGFLLFIISYCMLSLHIITFPQEYVGALRSNINKTKHQMNTTLFNFDTHEGLTVKIYIIVVCTQQQWVLHISDVIRTKTLERCTIYTFWLYCDTAIGFC